MPLSNPIAVDLFRGLTDPEAQKVARLSAERRYRRGAVIFARGDPADSLYIVKEGKVRILFLSDKGTETIVHILDEGGIFGELLLSEENRAFTAMAATDVLVTAFSKRSFLEILGAIPAVSGNFIRLLSSRLAKVERGFGDFAHTWSYHRLARVLLQLCDEYGKETAQGTAILLRLTHEDIANMIGTTRETVTTQLNRFRRLKLVGRQGANLIVFRRRLEEFARGEKKRPGVTRG